MEFISTLAGKLKIVTLVCGLCALGIMGNIFDRYYGRSDKEKTFFAFIIIAFIVSLLLVGASILKLSNRVSQWKTIDAALHAVLGALLAIGWILYVIFVSDLDAYYRKGWPRPAPYRSFLAKESFVLIFEAINIPLYFIIAFLVYKK
ncbi:unnamed protein product [Allacma fusca]|uniref:Uncharacterized protein n=1 Tax=Allacma fusca TaxID=39272 RepID=A0A8J2M8R9_9HEXA|nr:unnamed protein product [Allacma fusca]